MEDLNNKINCCVYMHVNKINGKMYIGWTSRNPEDRWGVNGNQYTKKYHPVFYAAINKYKWDNFEHIIIQDGLTEDEAKQLEIYLIALYRTNVCRWGNEANGYNMTDGGDGTTGHKQTEDARKKISDASKKHWENEEYRLKQIERLIGENNPFYGKSHTEETKNVLRIASTGKIPSEETCIKISEALTGIKRSEETKKKMSESQKQLYQDEDRRLQLSVKLKEYYANPENHPNYGKHLSEETKRKIAIANGRPVLQFSKNGEFIEEYLTTEDAAKLNNVHQANISKCCLKEYVTTGGYMWIYKDEYDQNKSIFEQVKQYDFYQTRPDYVSPDNVSIVQLDKNGEFIQEYRSIAYAIRETDIIHICECCQGKRKTAGGFKWMYKEDYDKLTQQNDSNEIKPI
jgi:group I intron endonuclease